MPATYTQSLKLIIQGYLDPNWAINTNTIFSALDALAPIAGLNVAPFEQPVSTSRLVTIAAGSFVRISDGATVAVAVVTSLGPLAASNDSYIYLDSAGAAQFNTTGFPAAPAEILPLAIVTTDATTVTLIADQRFPLRTVGPNSQAVFVASGASHAKGLVPDPGASAGTAKYLREDGGWVKPPGTALGTVALTAQTAAIGSTTFLASPGAGLYLVSVYLEVTTTGTSGNVVANLLWTDDVGATGAVAAVTLAVTATGRASALVPVRLASGSLNYSVTYSGTAGATQFAIYIGVSQLF